MEGKAHTCGGWYRIDDFIEKKKSLHRDTLDAEWLNKKPSRAIFVYVDWNITVHVIPRMEIGEDNVIVVGGIDFGTGPGHPFVYHEYLLDIGAFRYEVENAPSTQNVIKAKITFYLNHEYRSDGDTLDAHVKRIQETPNYYEGMPIFVDKSAKQAILDMEEIYGVVTIGAENYPGAVPAGIEVVKVHLQYDVDADREPILGTAYFYVFEDYFHCDNVELMGTVGEMAKYKYERTKDGRPNKKVPFKMDDHGPDVVRYVINGVNLYLRTQFQPVAEYIESEYWG